MLRRASVVLGMAVLLSLVIPLKALLKHSGVDAALGMRELELVAACVLLALLPAFALFHDAQLARRIPRWNIWVAVLAFCSVLFLLLHFTWPLQLAADYAKQALPPGIPHRTVLAGIELAARLGVLVSLVGVLVNLDAVPDEEAPVKRRKK